MKRALAALLPLLPLLGCGSAQKCPDPPPPVIVHQTGPAATTSTGAPAPTSPNQPAPGVFHIEVAKDGSLSIEGTRLKGPSELAERARASAKDRPDLLVIVVAEADTPYGHVYNAYETAKTAGFARVTIGTGKAPAPTASAKPLQSIPQLASGDTFPCEVSNHIDDLKNKSAFIAIHVGPDGNPQTVDVLEDPGSGLGETARQCAMSQKYRPAVDTSGKPIPGVKKLRIFFQEHHH
jgi:biopolymer transport protein ExbD